MSFRGSSQSDSNGADPRLRRGLTLIEVLIALIVFSIGGLGLAASSAVIIRQISSNQSRMRSASIARARDESFHAKACGAFSSGEDRTSGVRSVWRVTPGPAATLDQDLERASMTGVQADKYLSATPCE